MRKGGQDLLHVSIAPTVAKVAHFPHPRRIVATLFARRARMAVTKVAHFPTPEEWMSL
jgi:hypothetical protein